MSNPYETLGVKSDASNAEIKAAYRRKANETHPDKGGEPDAFLAVSNAFRILSDERDREYFDRTGKEKQKVDVSEVAKAVVGVAIQEIIISPGFRPESSDLIAETRKKIHGEVSRKIKDARGEVRNLEKRLNKFREAIDRTSSTDPQNAIIIVMERAVKEINKAIRGIEDDIKTEELIQKAALSILKNYNYKFDNERARLDQYFRTGGIWSNGETSGIWQ